MINNDAIAAAQEYAAKWHVPWGTITTIETQRALLLLFAVSDFRFCFKSEYGIGEADVSRPKWTVTRFEFFPNDSDHVMVPLWAAYPGYNSVTSGWRQGSGEIYKYRWHAWYRGLSDAKQKEYRHRYPAPQDADLCWNNFYHLIADVPGNPASITDLLLGRVPGRDA